MKFFIEFIKEIFLGELDYCHCCQKETRHNERSKSIHGYELTAKVCKECFRYTPVDIKLSKYKDL